MMKKIVASAIVAASLSPAISLACTFSYQVYGNTAIKERIDAEIGNKVTEEYCKKYNKEYQIVILTSAFTSSKQSLGYALVGLRKKGTKDVPANARSGYWARDGNYAIGVAYEMAAKTALENIVDVMSDIPSFLN